MAEKTNISELDCLLREFSANAEKFIKVMERAVTEKKEHESKRQKRISDDMAQVGKVVQIVHDKGFLPLDISNSFGDWMRGHHKDQEHEPVFDLIIALSKYIEDEQKKQPESANNKD